MATDILLCRHGQTAWNTTGRLQGQLDTELDETGRGQAEALAVALTRRKIDPPLAPFVYASDLKRVSETAAICVGACYTARAFPAELFLDARLRERKLGPFQGLTEAQALSRHAAEWQRFLRGRPVDGVEDDLQVMTRVAESLRCIARTHPGRTILVFSHGGAIHGAVRALTGSTVHVDIVNCSITHLRSSADPAGRWEALCVGENPLGAPSIRNADATACGYEETGGRKLA
jgi:probable phosphoglycerate mutase